MGGLGGGGFVCDKGHSPMAHLGPKYIPVAYRLVEYPPFTEALHVPHIILTQWKLAALEEIAYRYVMNSLRYSVI
jgi:hypothetical protein